MSIEAILNLTFSLITVLTALIAIWISLKQVKNSNKQSLFERRLKIYLIIKWMHSLCSQHTKTAESYLKNSETGILHSIGYLFILMTNFTYLEEIGPVIDKTIDNKELHPKYLYKVEDLKNLAEEARLIYPKNLGNELGTFIDSYVQMLESIFKYKTAINSIAKECNDLNHPFPKDNKLEHEWRNKVVLHIYDTFNLYEKMTSSELLKHVKKQIKL